MQTHAQTHGGDVVHYPLDKLLRGKIDGTGRAALIVNIPSSLWPIQQLTV